MSVRRRQRLNFGETPTEALEQRALLTGSVPVPVPGSVHADAANATLVQTDGKIVVAGYAQVGTSGDTDFALTRLNADGTPDIFFGILGKAVIPFNLGGAGEDVATSMALQSDGKIVVGGYAQIDSSNFDFAAVRLNTDGTLDDTFGSGGKVLVSFDAIPGGDDRANGVAIAPSGNIVLVGDIQRNFTGNYDFGVAQLTAEGSLDTTFSTDGLKLVAFNRGGDKEDRASAVTVQPNGAIVVVGTAQRTRSGDHDMAITRITSRGSLDTSFAKTGYRTVSFNLGGTKDDGATSVVLDGDRIVIAGYAENTDAGNYDFAAVRLTRGGSLDRSFSQDGKQTYGFDVGETNEDRAQAVVVQPDGKMLLAGSVELSSAGDYDFGVIRLTSNGSMDPTFTSDFSGAVMIPIDLEANGTDQAYAAALQSDGNLIVAGFASKDATGDSDFAVARVLPDSTLDALFSSDGLLTVGFDL